MKQIIYRENINGQKVTHESDKNILFQYTKDYVIVKQSLSSEFTAHGYIVPQKNGKSLFVSYTNAFDTMELVFNSPSFKKKFLAINPNISRVLRNGLNRNLDEIFVMKERNITRLQDETYHWCFAKILPFKCDVNTLNHTIPKKYIEDVLKKCVCLNSDILNSYIKFDVYLSEQLTTEKNKFLSQFFFGGMCFAKNSNQLRSYKNKEYTVCRYTYNNKNYNIYFALSEYMSIPRLYAKIPFLGFVYIIIKGKKINRFKNQYPNLCKAFSDENTIRITERKYQSKKDYYLSMDVKLPDFEDKLSGNGLEIKNILENFIVKANLVIKEIDTFVKSDTFKKYSKQIQNKTFKQEPSDLAITLRSAYLIYRVIAAFSGNSSSDSGGWEKLGEIDLTNVDLPDLSNFDWINLEKFDISNIPDFSEIDFNISDNMNNISCDCDFDFEIDNFTMSYLDTNSAPGNQTTGSHHFRPIHFPTHTSSTDEDNEENDKNSK